MIPNLNSRLMSHPWCLTHVVMEMIKPSRKDTEVVVQYGAKKFQQIVFCAPFWLIDSDSLKL